jgi:acetoin utilization protein AcuB
MTAVRAEKKKRPHVHEPIDKYMTPAPHTIGKDQTLAKAHELMREYRIRHLPVLEGGKLIGILSDRDLKLVETLKDVDPRTVLVSEAMTEEPYCVAPLASLESVVREMAQKKYGSAVVMEGERVHGIFTAIDGLQALAWILDQLED